jgi:mono/diheme cytochrome c family protein
VISLPIRSAIPLFAFFMLACSARRGEPLRGQLDVSNPQVARGQVAFMAKCDKCHPGGDAGLGPALNNKPLPGFLMRYQARHGLGAMPAFSKQEIPAPELDDVVAYLKALRHNG